MVIPPFYLVGNAECFTGNHISMKIKTFYIEQFISGITLSNRMGKVERIKSAFKVSRHFIIYRNFTFCEDEHCFAQ